MDVNARSQDFSVSDVISERLHAQYGDKMEAGQLKVLAKRTFEAIERLPPAEKKSFYGSYRSNNHVKLNGHIDAVAAKLLLNAESPWKPNVKFEDQLQKLIFNALRGELPPVRSLTGEGALLSSIVWQQDPKVFDKARSVIADIFVDMGKQLEGQKMDDASNLHMEMVVGELLSLYPFLAPVQGEKISIPMLVQGEWKLIPYVVDEISMAPTWMGSPLTAYGLHSEEKGAPPILLYKGTTYFADKGAFQSILTDFNPLASVGRYGFRMGKGSIKKWLDANTTDKKAVVYGKSLGGAQAWRTALHFPKQVDKVMAYGAPGFFPDERSRLRSLEKKGELPTLNFFCQANDYVPYSDLSSDKGVNYYEVLGGKIKGNPIGAHADVYATHARSAVLRMEPETIASGWKRTAVTVTRLAFSLFFVPLLWIYAAKTAFTHIIDLAQKARVRLVARPPFERRAAPPSRPTGSPIRGEASTQPY